MTQTEYAKVKQECLSDFCKEHGFIETADVKGIFGYAFDRAYALGKQEKEANKKKSPKFKIGDKVRVKYPPCKGLIGEIDSIGDRILEYHLSGNERLENVNFAESYLELVQDADTVVQGWVARDAGERWHERELHLFTRNKPERRKLMGDWIGRPSMMLDSNLFPDLIWSDEPEPVEIIIKRKKKTENQ